MRNIPVFTTEFGVASLILREIPYTKRAYITIQSSLSPVELLKECQDFCRAAGAEKIYATGAQMPLNYPLYTSVLRMEVMRSMLPASYAVAVPVEPEQAEFWKKIHNQAMADVDNASFMDDMDVKQMLQQGDGYFVYEGKELIGIGRAAGDEIRVVAATVRGGGKNTVLALAKCLREERIRLDVASTNRRGIRLYESLGFRQTAVLSQWYKIL